ncbi:MAG: type II toxin-antitoxin system HicA family toxin [Anaerolineae bacterium]|nr:type II toxin-antitoxin system HicA family toxin [Anaerolineae bacterium]MBL8104120.1 type II toxin-antitoxin system HicA family toxin [Anaerolineales bacterium]MCC7190976.1 type II toxin-antitoxin system HicA family toxin [Anaerolineales bacterium]
MPKLPVLKPRQVLSALEKAGFRQVRQKGSHIQFKRGNLLVTVPNHPGDINPQVLRSIMRQSQLTAEEFIELLK